MIKLKDLLKEVKAEQEITLIRERHNQLNELDFGSQKSFDSYQKQHDMRGDTQVTIAGKKMNVTQASGQSKDTDSKGSSVFGKNSDGGIMGKIKDFVGSKGFQFGARRPNEEEDKVAADHFSDYENKKINSIGVDKVTGNIYAANDDYEVVLSPKGKVLKSDTSITGKYNKDALDAYQSELEKDAEKYYKRQDIKNKLKSFLGYKPDEFGDYRF